MPGDSGAADRLRTQVALVHAVSTTRPRLVVQCGSSESTVALALAVQATRAGRVVTLEHDPTRAARVRARLQQEGLADVTEVRVSPLRAVSTGDASHRWYDPAVLDDLHDIGLLHLDLSPQDGHGDEDGGPDHGPAVPLLLQRCADGATLVVEASRTDVHDVGRPWPAEHPTLSQHTRDDERPVVLVHTARDDH
nr:class I SAM-dependent methyltransferase [Ornithinimicrobium sediminis]